MATAANITKSGKEKKAILNLQTQTFLANNCAKIAAIFAQLILYSTFSLAIRNNTKLSMKLRLLT